MHGCSECYGGTKNFVIVYGVINRPTSVVPLTSSSPATGFLSVISLHPAPTEIAVLYVPYAPTAILPSKGTADRYLYIEGGDEQSGHVVDTESLTIIPHATPLPRPPDHSSFHLPLPSSPASPQLTCPTVDSLSLTVSNTHGTLRIPVSNNITLVNGADHLLSKVTTTPWCVVHETVLKSMFKTLKQPNQRVLVAAVTGNSLDTGGSITKVTGVVSLGQILQVSKRLEGVEGSELRGERGREALYASEFRGMSAVRSRFLPRDGAVVCVCCTDNKLLYETLPPPSSSARSSKPRFARSPLQPVDVTHLLTRYNCHQLTLLCLEDSKHKHKTLLRLSGGADLTCGGVVKNYVKEGDVRATGTEIAKCLVRCDVWESPFFETGVFDPQCIVTECVEKAVTTSSTSPLKLALRLARRLDRTLTALLFTDSRLAHLVWNLPFLQSDVVAGLEAFVDDCVTESELEVAVKCFLKETKTNALVVGRLTEVARNARGWESWMGGLVTLFAIRDDTRRDFEGLVSNIEAWKRRLTDSDGVILLPLLVAMRRLKIRTSTSTTAALVACCEDINARGDAEEIHDALGLLHLNEEVFAAGVVVGGADGSLLKGMAVVGGGYGGGAVDMRIAERVVTGQARDGDMLPIVDDEGGGYEEQVRRRGGKGAK